MFIKELTNKRIYQIRTISLAILEIWSHHILTDVHILEFKEIYSIFTSTFCRMLNHGVHKIQERIIFAFFRLICSWNSWTLEFTGMKNASNPFQTFLNSLPWMALISRLSLNQSSFGQVQCVYMLDGGFHQQFPNLCFPSGYTHNFLCQGYKHIPGPKFSFVEKSKWRPRAANKCSIAARSDH